MKNSCFLEENSKSILHFLHLSIFLSFFSNIVWEAVEIYVCHKKFHPEENNENEKKFLRNSSEIFINGSNNILTGLHNFQHNTFQDNKFQAFQDYFSLKSQFMNWWIQKTPNCNQFLKILNNRKILKRILYMF